MVGCATYGGTMFARSECSSLGCGIFRVAGQCSWWLLGAFRNRFHILRVSHENLWVILEFSQ